VKGFAATGAMDERTFKIIRVEFLGDWWWFVVVVAEVVHREP
jgi:hypothetical protein